VIVRRNPKGSDESRSARV